MTGDEITPEVLEVHKKTYLEMMPDEKPLIVLNHKRMFGGTYAFTGIVISNTHVHFKSIHPSFTASLVPRMGMHGCRSISGINSIEIAEHDSCLGTSYIGHQLKIDDMVMGLVRMGTGILLDEHAIAFLNGLFNNLADSGVIKQHVKNYAWQ